MALPAQQVRSAALLAIAWLTASCGNGEAPHVALSGSAMGTSWHVTAVSPPADIAGDALERAVGDAIEAVEQSMSTYIETSDLSRFNRQAGTGWHAVPAEFCDAVSAALAISEETGGAFDPTAGSLVNLWGFGPETMRFEPPPAARLEAARALSGYEKLEADCSRPALRKADGALYVDLSAVAKGYAVDRVAEILDAQSVRNYLVEIGGEEGRYEFRWELQQVGGVQPAPPEWLSQFDGSS